MLFLIQATRIVSSPPCGEIVDQLPTFMIEGLTAAEARHKASSLLGSNLRGVERVHIHAEPVFPEVLRRMEQENAGVFG